MEVNSGRAKRRAGLAGLRLWRGVSSKRKATEIRFSPSADKSGMNIYQRGSDGEEEEEEEDDQRPRSALL